MVEDVALPLLIRDVHGDRTTPEEHPHISILWRKRDKTLHKKKRLSQHIKYGLRVLYFQ